MGHPLCTVHNFIFTDKKIFEDIWSQENRQNMTNSFKTHLKCYVSDGIRTHTLLQRSEL